MPKEIKGLSGRKAPVPSTDHDAIDDWFKNTMPSVRPIIEALDELIRATIPDLNYAVKWSKAHYGHSELGWIIEVAAYNVSVNIVFFGGADFPNPPPLGTTDRTRYVKIDSVADLLRPDIQEWIEEAGRTPGWSSS